VDLGLLSEQDLALRPGRLRAPWLREALEREAAAGPEDTETLATTDADIHRTLAAPAGNRVVQALTDWIFDVVQPSLIEILQPAGVRARILEQHRALLAAVEQGDPEAAERAMQEHLLYLREIVRGLPENVLRA
jgi:DNA-binding FadR family transcriptional regulator